MSGFILRINGLTNVPYAAALQASLPFDQSFEVEYLFNRQWNMVIVKPILVHSVVIFLVNFPGRDGDSMALVYNEKDTWSDIEKESTRQTTAIGIAIENYYSNRYLPVPPSHLLN
jgi:hypothetical protein